MKRTLVFYTEAAYFLGLVILALGTAFMEKSAFGVSMVVASSYVIHLKVCRFLSFYSFGMSEYVFQGVLLCVLFLILRKFKAAFLFSFASAFLFGIMLDCCIFLLHYLNYYSIIWRGAYYVIGVFLCSVGVSFVFHTYLPPEVYELFVKELSRLLNKPIEKVKLVYDLSSCLMGICLSFLFFGFGKFSGVKLGTLLCAAVNGPIIGVIDRFLERHFEFKDRLPYREFFSF